MARPAGVVRSRASVSDTESNPEMLQFLQSGQQIGHGSAPAIQPPDQHDIDLLPATGGF